MRVLREVCIHLFISAMPHKLMVLQTENRDRIVYDAALPAQYLAEPYSQRLFSQCSPGNVMTRSIIACRTMNRKYLDMLGPAEARSNQQASFSND